MLGAYFCAQFRHDGLLLFCEGTVVRLDRSVKGTKQAIVLVDFRLMFSGSHLALHAGLAGGYHMCSRSAQNTVEPRTRRSNAATAASRVRAETHARPAMWPM